MQRPSSRSGVLLSPSRSIDVVFANGCSTIGDVMPSIARMLARWCAIGKGERKAHYVMRIGKDETEMTKPETDERTFVLR
jgi:hypothetical protein